MRVIDNHAGGSSGRPSLTARGGAADKLFARGRSRQSSRPPHSARRRTPTHVQDTSPGRWERSICFLRFAPALPWTLQQLRSCTPCYPLGKSTGGERLTDISRKIRTVRAASVLTDLWLPIRTTDARWTTGGAVNKDGSVRLHRRHVYRR